MDTTVEYGRKGGSAGPIAAIIALAIAFVLLSGLELEMFRALAGG